MSNSPLIEKLLALTGGKYDFLRLKNIDFRLEKGAAGGGSCVITYMFPEREALSDGEMEDISALTRRIMNLKIKSEIQFKKSHIDTDFLRRDLYKYLAAGPAVSGTLNEEDIKIEKPPATESGKPDCVISVFFDPRAYEYAQSRDLKGALNAHIEKTYCMSFALNFLKKEPPVCHSDMCHSERSEESPAQSDTDTVVIKSFEADGVTVAEIERYIGNEIKDPPITLARIVSPRAGAVTCGRIKFASAYDLKKGENLDARHFFSFLIEHEGAQLKVIYISTPETDARAASLLPGTDILVYGMCEEEEYNGRKQLRLKATSISLCRIVAQPQKERKKNPPPLKYTSVFPKDILVVEAAQTDLFSRPKELSAYIKDNVFVVFDVETTGLNSMSDRIIELSAVKIIGGAVRAEFSTLINPETRIPGEITAITGITNDDVKDSPVADAVIGDFYKFCDGCTIVAHNIDFDYGFISRAGDKFNYIFDNPQLDTIKLCQKYAAGMRRFSLSDACRHFGIVNERAHRAAADVAATAKLFLKLAELMN